MSDLSRFKRSKMEPVEIYKRALLLACERIADGPQQYHEANTPEGWAELFVQAARSGQSTDEVLAARPAARAMTDAECSELNLHVDALDASLAT